jgi:hypothetical protein
MSALPEVDAPPAQGQGRGQRRSRRQCGHAPLHGRDGCLRQRHSSPAIVSSLGGRRIRAVSGSRRVIGRETRAGKAEPHKGALDQKSSFSET